MERGTVVAISNAGGNTNGIVVYFGGQLKCMNYSTLYNVIAGNSDCITNMGVGNREIKFFGDITKLPKSIDGKLDKPDVFSVVERLTVERIGNMVVIVNGLGEKAFVNNEALIYLTYLGKVANAEIDCDKIGVIVPGKFDSKPVSLAQYTELKQNCKEYIMTKEQVKKIIKKR